MALICKYVKICDGVYFYRVGILRQAFYKKAQRTHKGKKKEIKFCFYLKKKKSMVQRPLGAKLCGVLLLFGSLLLELIVEILTCVLWPTLPQLLKYCKPFLL